MILMMINEAARCLEEQVVEKAAYLDMALILGTGFPPFRGGILRYADEIGLANIVDQLHQFSQSVSDRFKPADLLVEMNQKGKTFYLS